MTTIEKPFAAEDGCNDTLRSSSFNKPSWLLTTIADVEEKMKTLAALNMVEEDDEGDTFAERAETYYHKRPQLLALLHDLYNAYLSLAHRYSQSLSKHLNRQSFEIGFDINLNNDNEQQLGQQGQNEEYGDDASDTDDAKSSLSYQPPPPPPPQILESDASSIIAELVMKQVECDILVDEMSVTERMWGESSRKIELQKSLLEVLESERLILLNENARLGYRVGALVEENKGLATESMFIKRKAGELARCVLKMREDQRVCMMSRKIEDLQGQIYGLEKRNKEYYEQLVKVKRFECHHQQPAADDEMKKSGQDEEIKQQKVVNWMMREKQQQQQQRMLKKQGDQAAVNKTTGGGGGRKVSKWWDKLKNIDLFVCGPHYTSTYDV